MSRVRRKKGARDSEISRLSNAPGGATRAHVLRVHVTSHKNAPRHKSCSVLAVGGSPAQHRLKGTDRHKVGCTYYTAVCSRGYIYTARAMASFVQGLLFDEVGAAASATYPPLLLCYRALLATLSVVALGYVWWRSSEATRVRKIIGTTSRSSSSCLPSPVPFLPRWCGFIGGHTLNISPPKVLTTVLLCIVEFSIHRD